jgi:hypothetical protein
VFLSSRQHVRNVELLTGRGKRQMEREEEFVLEEISLLKSPTDRGKTASNAAFLLRRLEDPLL